MMNKYTKSTEEGRLYIENKDFFKINKVINIIKNFNKSSIYKSIENRKLKKKYPEIDFKSLKDSIDD